MKKILVISTTGMGDTLWSTPGIRALKKSFPNAQIDLLVDARWCSLFHGNPYIHRIYKYSKTWVRQIALKLQILLAAYDYALVFHANQNIRRLLPDIPTLFHQQFTWIAENQLVAIDGPVHGIQRRLTLIEKIGAKPAGGQMDLFFKDHDRAACVEFMNKNKLSPKEFIYLNVGASLPHKRWPADRFVDLARKILETTPYKIVLGGGPDEAKLILSIKATLDPARVTHAYGRPVRDNAFLIGQARMMVTCDSGPMHIGFALKIPTVAMFGVSDPRQSGPFELGDNICFLIQASKNPYSHPESVADNLDYFDQISLTTVWEKTQDALASVA